MITIGCEGAVVTRVSESVTILICLLSVWNRRTIIEDISEAYRERGRSISALKYPACLSDLKLSHPTLNIRYVGRIKRFLIGRSLKTQTVLFDTTLMEKDIFQDEYILR